MIKMLDSRFEKKFVIPDHMLSRIKFKLNSVFNKDNQFFNNEVSSLYLDDIDLKNLNSTINGEFERKKVRIRTYSNKNVNEKNIYLEIKQKSNNRSFKKRNSYLKVPIDFNSDYDLLNKFYLAKNSEINIKLNKIYNKVIFINYKRLRFDDFKNNTRISLDTEIKSKLTSEKMTSYNFKNLKINVLELKNKNLNGITETYKQIIDKEPLIWTSFSKYSTCFFSHSENKLKFGYGNHIINS